MKNTIYTTFSQYIWSEKQKNDFNDGLKLELVTLLKKW